MTERFLTKAQAADMLGMSSRRVYALMASGEIQSYCVNPQAERKRYLTTASALEHWQETAMAPKGRKAPQMSIWGDDAGWECDRHGNRRIARRR